MGRKSLQGASAFRDSVLARWEPSQTEFRFSQTGTVRFDETPPSPRPPHPPSSPSPRLLPSILRKSHLVLLRLFIASPVSLTEFAASLADTS